MLRKRHTLRHSLWSGPASFRPEVLCLEDRCVPATIVVTTTADVVDANDGMLSLREAISLANTTAELDTIKLSTGDYKIELPGSIDDANASGDFDITQPLILKGKGSQTVVDGNSLDRVFDVQFGDITFQKLTIRNGNVNDDGGGVRAEGNVTILDSKFVNNQASFDGGGFWNDGETTIQNSKFKNNRAGDSGGGFFTRNGDVVLTNAIVMGNSSGFVGGGFFGERTAIVTDSTVQDNESGQSGGGFYVASGVTVAGSTIQGNRADSNGGGFHAGPGVTVTNSTIQNNQATLGGGFYTADGDITVENSTIQDNLATIHGGGFYTVISNDTHVIDSTITGNQAGGWGGGMWFAGNRELTIIHATIAFNQATQTAGGIFATLSSTVRVGSSIIAKNTAASGPDVFEQPNDGTDFESLGHNLIGSLLGLDGINGANNDEFGPQYDDLVGVNPKLDKLAKNGGPTKTHALKDISPALNAADPGMLDEAGFVDQRNFIRPDSGGLPDIGAFENDSGGPAP